MKAEYNWLSCESEVLRRIIFDKCTLANTIRFALNGAFPYPEHVFGQDVLVGINIPREVIGLPSGFKPGDIDCLVIPFRGSLLLVDKIIAIEVKVLRPTIANPGRNVNKMGVTQACGLLRDGFPFVGLVHLSIPERLPIEYHWWLKKFTGRVLSNGILEEEKELMPVDPFPLLSAQRQYGRVQSLGLPDEIGYNVIGFNLSRDGQSFSGNTIGNERRPLQNPSMSEALIKSIHKLAMSKQEIFHRVKWYNN
jgi:hypothetical protein